MLGDVTQRIILKNIFLVSGIFPGKKKKRQCYAVGFECTIYQQHFIKIVGAIFWQNLNVYNFFLCKLPLILTVVSLIGQDWSVGLGAPLGAGHTEKLNFFLVSEIFSGKAESVTLLGVECTVNPQNLINFVGAIFEKIEIL